MASRPAGHVSDTLRLPHCAARPPLRVFPLASQLLVARPSRLFLIPGVCHWGSPLAPRPARL